MWGTQSSSPRLKQLKPHHDGPSMTATEFPNCRVCYVASASCVSRDFLASVSAVAYCKADDRSCNPQTSGSRRPGPEYHQRIIHGKGKAGQMVELLYFLVLIPPFLTGSTIAARTIRTSQPRIERIELSSVKYLFRLGTRKVCSELKEFAAEESEFENGI